MRGEEMGLVFVLWLFFPLALLALMTWTISKQDEEERRKLVDQGGRYRPYLSPFLMTHLPLFLLITILPERWDWPCYWSYSAMDRWP